MSTLTALLDRRAAAQPERLAYVFLADGETEQSRLDYATLRHQALAIAVRLTAAGAGGGRALLLYPPGLDFLAGFFGCLYAGVTAVPAYPLRGRRPDARLESIARDAELAAVLTPARLLAARERLGPDSPLARLPWLAGDVEASASAPEPTAMPVPRDLALLQYTSGSTASPRGVMVDHACLLHNLEDLDRGWEHGPDDALVSWLPAFHDMGLVYGLLMPLYKGFPCYLMAPAAFLARPLRWLEALSRYRGTHGAAPNFAYDLCVERSTPESRAGLDLSHWRVALNGAEPVRAGTLERFAAAFGPQGFLARSFCPGYGLAEATLKVTALPAHRDPAVLRVDGIALAQGRVLDATGPQGRDLVGCGRSQIDTRILIVDPLTRVPRPPDRVGEIWVAGRTLARGYWGRPQDSAETFQAHTADGDGPWLRTGDLGFVRDGELFITGRHKETLVLQGLNHYPQDIEYAIQASHPALALDAGAAFTVATDTGEGLVVVNELRREGLRKTPPEQVLAAMRRRLAEDCHLQPQALALLRPGGVLKTSSGKIRRGACRDAFLADELPMLARWRADPAHCRETPADYARLGSGAVSAWLEDWLTQRLETRPDPRRSLADCGLDSALAVELATALGDWLGRPLDATLLWNFPSIQALAGHLAGEAGTPEPVRRAEQELDDLSAAQLAELLAAELRR